MNEYQSQVLDINVEEWYDLIKDETFYTEFVPITIDDAKVFLQAYEETQAVDKTKEIPQFSEDIQKQFQNLSTVSYQLSIFSS